MARLRLDQLLRGETLRPTSTFLFSSMLSVDAIDACALATLALAAASLARGAGERRIEIVGRQFGQHVARLDQAVVVDVRPS